MADLILLMPEWTNALSELMSKLSGSPATVPAEVLLLLPEEVDSRHLKLGLNRRSQIKQMLSLSAPHIAQFLHSMLVEDGSGVARQVSVVKCYSSCIQLLHSTFLSAGERNMSPNLSSRFPHRLLQ